MKKVILTAGMLLWAVHPALAQSADPSLLIHEQFAKIDTNIINQLKKLSQGMTQSN